MKRICLFFFAITLFDSSIFAAPMKDAPETSKLSVHGALVYLQPNAGNMLYGVFVSGTQPFDQSWYNQVLQPSYSPGFDVGVEYFFNDPSYHAAIDWLHLNASTSNSKQADITKNTLGSAFEFVGPPFEIGPEAFGIKHIDGNANFSFDTITLNADKQYNYDQKLQARIFAGVDILRVYQQITTTLSDFVGAQATPFSDPLPADPSYMFRMKNTSHYLGAGPDLGLNLQYSVFDNFGVTGQALGTLTAGTSSAHESFNATSNRLTANGIALSQQEISLPNTTQVVPGFDGRLGLFYHYKGKTIQNLTVEAGYRLAFYKDAIAEVTPTTVLQPGVGNNSPQLSTGTMAIASLNRTNYDFYLNGPYIDFKLAFN